MVYDENGEMKKESTKYAMVYPKGEKDGEDDDNEAVKSNYAANKRIFGDSIRETSIQEEKGIKSWNNEISLFWGRYGVFTTRGWSYGANSSGIHAFIQGNGAPNFNSGFRVVLINK